MKMTNELNRMLANDLLHCLQECEIHIQQFIDREDYTEGDKLICKINTAFNTSLIM
jgi:hypothetical protein